MPRRIAASTLNASTLDILNTIRANATMEYQNAIPKVEKAVDIPKVGELILGTPAFSNQFLNALINRIALVRVQSATFNNPYSRLKKGYLQFGETVEEIFINIAKVYEYDPEKAEAREFRRYIPDVQSAFHTMNWRVLYPVTIQESDLQLAFLSMDGVQNLIAKIVDSIYTAYEYDEFLLFKYLLIKAISHGKIYPVSINEGLDNAAIMFRGLSNRLTFMNTQYNEFGVKTTTPKSRQIIFMDAMYNATYDVSVLAAAFNMEKAEFAGSLYLIDDFTTFDNERFEEIRAVSDGIEEVTGAELALLNDVKAVTVDEEWFQVYDNKNKFTEKYVASCDYWNYFYHTWKTVSHSPFANAVVYVTDTANIELPATINAEIMTKDQSEEAVVFTLSTDAEAAGLAPNNVIFKQTEAMASKLIAMHKYGAVIIPQQSVAENITLVAEINGAEYTAGTALTAASSVGDTITLTKAAAANANITPASSRSRK